MQPATGPIFSDVYMSKSRGMVLHRLRNGRGTICFYFRYRQQLGKRLQLHFFLHFVRKIYIPRVLIFCDR